MNLRCAHSLISLSETARTAAGRDRTETPVTYVKDRPRRQIRELPVPRIEAVQRSSETEILECPGLAEQQVARVYRDLTRIHRLLGDIAWIASAVRRDPKPVRRLLDVGCGQGGVLRVLRERLAVDAIGVDLVPPARIDDHLPILRANAVSDCLPVADVAYSTYLGHHLSEDELVKLIRNVGRSCRRFILLDLVRHPLPLRLFRGLVAPWLSPIAAADGQVSIRRSFTPAELGGIALEALAGSGAHFDHAVAPLYIRQTLDIVYDHH
jgi:SAM-dependent methyltransferase